MSPNSDVRDQPGAERINELYWNSERTIGEITDELGVSRNALYTAIHPLAAGVSCQDCGERMVFTNRTRRDTATAVCRACGSETDLERGAALRREGNPAAQGERRVEAGNAVGGAGSWSRWRDELASVEPERVALVGGAAALGAMFGAVAARALRDWS